MARSGTPRVRQRALVTPEGVLLDVPVAGLVSRVLAKLIDMAVYASVAGAVMLGAAWLLSGVTAQPTFYVTMMVSLAFVLVVGLPALVEYLSGGRSLGKLLLGLRVVSMTGSPVGPMAVFLRSLALPTVDFISFVLPLGLVVAVLTHWSQRVGDLLAGTMVVTDRKVDARVQPASFFPPSGTEAIVASIETSSLTAEQYHLVRSFLVRAPTLTGLARQAIAADLATRVMVSLAMSTTFGLQPEAFLACVASAYQQRGGAYPVLPVVVAVPAWGAEAPIGGVR